MRELILEMWNGLLMFLALIGTCVAIGVGAAAGFWLYALLTKTCP